MDIREARWSAVLLEAVQEIASRTSQRQPAAFDEAMAIADHWKLILQWIELQLEQSQNLDIILQFSTAKDSLLFKVLKALTGATVQPLSAAGYYMLPRYDEPVRTRYEIITCTDILQHVAGSPVQFLKQIAGCLSVTGVLYVTCPDSETTGKTYKYVTGYQELPTISSSIADEPQWQYNQAEITAIVAAAGLVIKRFGYTTDGTTRFMNFALRPA